MKYQLQRNWSSSGGIIINNFVNLWLSFGGKEMVAKWRSCIGTIGNNWVDQRSKATVFRWVRGGEGVCLRGQWQWQQMAKLRTRTMAGWLEKATPKRVTRIELFWHRDPNLYLSGRRNTSRPRASHRSQPQVLMAQWSTTRRRPKPTAKSPPPTCTCSTRVDNTCKFTQFLFVKFCHIKKTLHVYWLPTFICSDGTTDVTRTLHFGTPTDFQKVIFLYLGGENHCVFERFKLLQMMFRLSNQARYLSTGSLHASPDGSHRSGDHNLGERNLR